MKLLISLAATGMFACAAPLFAQDTPKVDFQKDILPILESKCIECHNDTVQKSKLRMDTRAFLLQGGTEGPAFIEGKSAESMMIKLVEGTHPDFQQMPPKSDPLTPEQIALMKAWIDQGAVWPEEVKASQFPVLAKAEGLPEDWLVEATAQQGALAKWALSKEVKGPNDVPAITVTPAAPADAATANLLYTPKASFKDGSVEVQIKALAGTDLGGGIIWRVQNKNNYYLARYSSATSRFVICKVVDGVETELAGADFTAPAAEEWITLKIEQQGNTITGAINGQKLVEATDDTLVNPGGVGYLTKGDSATAFAGAKLNPQS